MYGDITQLDCLTCASLRKSNPLCQRRILRLFSKLINARSLGSWCVKVTEESTPGKDSLVPRMPHDVSYVGLICLVKKRKMCFRV